MRSYFSLKTARWKARWLGCSHCSEGGRSGRWSWRLTQPSQPGAARRACGTSTGAEARPKRPSSTMPRVGSPATLLFTAMTLPGGCSGSGSGTVSSTHVAGSSACV